MFLIVWKEQKWEEAGRLQLGGALAPKPFCIAV